MSPYQQIILFTKSKPRLLCRASSVVHEQQRLSLTPPYQQQIQQIVVQNASAGFYALQSTPEGQGSGVETSTRVAWDESPLQVLSQLPSFEPSTEVTQVPLPPPPPPQLLSFTSLRCSYIPEVGWVTCASCVGNKDF